MHGERYAVRPQTWTGSPPPTACWPSARRRFACSSRSRELRSRGGRESLHHAGLPVPARGRLADELPPASVHAACARHGLRRNGPDPRALPHGDCRAVPLLLVRRCDARPLASRLWIARRTFVSLAMSERAMPRGQTPGHGQWGHERLRRRRHGWRGSGRRPSHGARRRADAGVHAGRHEGDGQGVDPEELERSGRRSCSATRTT